MSLLLHNIDDAIVVIKCLMRTITTIEGRVGQYPSIGVQVPWAAAAIKKDFNFVCYYYYRISMCSLEGVD